jgi:hypothetical protein
MVENRRNHSIIRDSDDLETLSTENTSHYKEKDGYSFVSKADPYADYIRDIYLKMQHEAYLPIKGAFMISTPLALLLFAMFVSTSTSNLIAFGSLINAITYIIFSLWMLGWILEKDIGPRSMQEVAEPIREGSEGFFMT